MSLKAINVIMQPNHNQAGMLPKMNVFAMFIILCLRSNLFMSTTHHNHLLLLTTVASAVCPIRASAYAVHTVVLAMAIVLVTFPISAATGVLAPATLVEAFCAHSVAVVEMH
jgi:hypothetical protein